jgi:diadenosine tetraphosphatase ApaH/serine/threonine PP2A family protein phosphatase
MKTILLRCSLGRVCDYPTPYCLVGHTHTPAIYQDARSDGAIFRPFRPNEPLLLSKERLIINPGSVGQPRDSDPRAAYAILDTARMSFQHHRVEYPIIETQERMRSRGMSYRLIVRLDYGW